MRMIRLSAFAALGWAMLCNSAIVAQTPGENVDNKKLGKHDDELVSYGKDLELMEGDSANKVVVIGGSAKIHGTVARDVVVIGGDAQIDGHVKGEVVDIMGNVEVTHKAIIDGELVTVGGTNLVEQGAKVSGRMTEIATGGMSAKYMKFRWMTDWFSQCVLKMRPLSFGVGWVWWIAGFFFILYLLIAVTFPHPVQCSAAQIANRPATTFAAGILTCLALPILCALLAITFIGLVVVPFLIVAACLIFLVGKVGVLEHFGGKICGAFGWSAGQRPLIAFLIAAVLLTLLYIVPFVGLLTFCIFSCWGLGAGITAICVALRASRPLPPPPAQFGTPPPASVAAESPAPLSMAASVPPLAPPSALAFPRAGFWERMGAGFLDMVLIMLATALFHPIFVFVAVAYFSALWAWKGTTVGGIVLNLQVVRLDGQPLNFLMAFVRSLAAFFSALIFFLGFFWIGWDRDKQGWHDKLAGTVVVRLPRSVSLVCF